MYRMVSNESRAWSHIYMYVYVSDVQNSTWQPCPRHRRVEDDRFAHPLKKENDVHHASHKKEQLKIGRSSVSKLKSVRSRV